MRILQTSALRREAKQHMQAKKYTHIVEPLRERGVPWRRDKSFEGRAGIEVRKWEIAVSECGCVVVKEREERSEKRAGG